MIRTFFTLVALGTFVTGASAQTTNGSPDLKEIRYHDLKSIVSAHRGKVLVVDFWEFF